MNADRLVAHYEKFADTPDAIPRLRRFILDLAVRGRLVPQDPNDEPASELLKRIAVEKARLVKAGEIRRPKEPALLDERELPFVVPNGWSVAPLDGLSPRSLSDGDWIETKDQSEDGSVRLIQLADVGVGKFLNKSARYVTEETEFRLNCTRLVVGDVLIARLPNPIGRACIFPDIGQPAITAVDVAILRPDFNVSAGFLVLAINAPPVREQIEAYGKGATRFRVSTGHLKTVQVPVPPLAEQHRIVAKVDELMALCDRLAAARAVRETMRDRLVAASLARLNTPDPETFQADARFALDALPAITARPDQIKALRQTILNLAVRGKLVPQDPNDEPASELLKRIAAEKARLVSQGTLKEERNPKVPRSNINLFELPQGWTWGALQSICLSISDGDHQPPPKSETGVPFLVIGDVRTKTINYDAARTVPQEYYDGLDPIRKPRCGDLLYTLVGSFGIPVPVLSDAQFCVQRHIGILRPSKQVELRAAALLLESEFAFKQAEAVSTGIAQKTVSLAGLRSMALPIPPLAEQRRIVAKVDELMALCDRLEASLTTADETRRRLLEALLAEALAPAEDRAMAAAE